MLHSRPHRNCNYAIESRSGQARSDTGHVWSRLSCDIACFETDRRSSRLSTPGPVAEEGSRLRMMKGFPTLATLLVAAACGGRATGTDNGQGASGGAFADSGGGTTGSGASGSGMAGSGGSTGVGGSSGAMPGQGGAGGGTGGIGAGLPGGTGGYPRVDEGNGCGISPVGTFEIVSCCNGAPCRGECLLIDGVKECRCFGLVGGCTASLACCSFSFTCIDPIACDFTR